MYSAVFGWNVLQLSIKSNWSNMSFKATVSLLIFFLDNRSTDVSGVLKSPTNIALQSTFPSISPFISVNICFVYLGALS